MPTVPAISNTDRLLDATATASQDEFSITWPVIADSEDDAVNDLVVLVDGVELSPSAYEFEGVAITGLSGIWNGGTVILADECDGGERVVIYSDRAPRRTGNFLEGKALPFTELDKLENDQTIQTRDLALHVRRSLKFSVIDLLGGEDGELTATVAQLEAAAAMVAAGGLIDGTLGALPTTTALLSLFGAGIVLVNGTTMITAGRSSASDGGGGIFRYDSSDTTTADNGVNIRVDSQSRRWKAVLPGFILDKMAGVVGDGTTDDSDAVQRLIAAAEVARLPHMYTKSSVKLTEGIAWDNYKTHPIGNGVKLSWATVVSSVAVPYCVEITTSNSDPNTMAQVHRARPIDGIFFEFPNYTTGVNGIKLTPVVLSALDWINGLVFQNGGYAGGLHQIEYGAGAFDITHINWGFSSTGSVTGSHGVYTTNNGSSNAGEANKFFNCFWANLAYPIYDAAGNSNCDMFLYGCSLDNATISLYSKGCRIYGWACHIERWDTYIAHVDDLVGGIFLHGGEVIQTDMAALANPPFRSESDILGIEIHDLHWGLAGVYAFDTLCESTGRFIIRGSNLGFNVGLIPFSDAGNAIPNGVFDSAIPGAWTISAGVTWDGTLGYVGNGAMKFDNTSNAVTSATIAAPCKPGEVVAAQAYIKSAGLSGSGLTRQMRLVYADVKGNTIEEVAVDNSTTTQGTFAKVRMGSLNSPAPPGTAQVILSFQIANGTANVQMWVDYAFLQVF